MKSIAVTNLNFKPNIPNNLPVDSGNSYCTILIFQTGLPRIFELKGKPIRSEDVRIKLGVKVLDHAIQTHYLGKVCRLSFDYIQRHYFLPVGAAAAVALDHRATTARWSNNDDAASYRKRR